MNYDDVAWERSDAIFDAWKKKLHENDTKLAIVNLIKKHRGGVPTELFAPQRGSYNVTIRLQFADGGSAVIRIPCPGIHMFPDEKIRNEVAVMKLISEKTTIAVPFVLHHGSAEECPGNLGPFIIMEWVQNAKTLSTMLNLPGLPIEERHLLNPGIDQSKLEFVYEQIADILIQLSRVSFDKIGAPMEVEEDVWQVTQRPLTFDMNDLVQLANCPPSSLLSTPFPTSSSFYNAIADMKIMHLEMQHNDAIDSAEDCRRKYTARRLFKKLASEKRLHDPEMENGPFRLWCDDLRPGNILVDENCRILSVIDWEFTYAAPSSFTFNPPWWLLLEAPEYWFRGITDWVRVYEPRMRTFIKVLAAREEAAIASGRLKEQERLSRKMEENWASGQFWIDYASRRSWAFDSAFWMFIDTKFFGGNGGGEEFEERLLGELGDEDREGLDEFVERKVEESKVRLLREWDE
ncbi:phosphotransferase family protein [Byssothecium circinans]|uniref:Phosphotransferase family protein n=1 Tax=Byssothecium circinans TaxID=147558 RepID=A0A6A5TK52_9PLEO|nr:phosphotransferase family protein [Byssothecium circinans]